jgi:hypothetical protein
MATPSAAACLSRRDNVFARSSRLIRRYLTLASPLFIYSFTPSQSQNDLENAGI